MPPILYIFLRTVIIERVLLAFLENIRTSFLTLHDLGTIKAGMTFKKIEVKNLYESLENPVFYGDCTITKIEHARDGFSFIWFYFKYLDFFYDVDEYKPHGVISELQFRKITKFIPGEVLELEK